MFSNTAGGQFTVVLCTTGDKCDHLESALRKEPDFCLQVHSDLVRAVEVAASGVCFALILEFDSITPESLAELERKKATTMPPVFVILGAHALPSRDRMGMLSAGISGFLDPQCGPDILRKAIACAREGVLWIDRLQLLALWADLLTSQDDDRFTRREASILRRIVAGLSNRAIAEELFITRDTVRWHLRCAYTKLGVHDRRQASELLRGKNWSAA